MHWWVLKNWKTFQPVTSQGLWWPFYRRKSTVFNLMHINANSLKQNEELEVQDLKNILFLKYSIWNEGIMFQPKKKKNWSHLKTEGFLIPSTKQLFGYSISRCTGKIIWRSKWTINAFLWSSSQIRCLTVVIHA